MFCSKYSHNQCKFALNRSWKTFAKIPKQYKRGFYHNLFLKINHEHEMFRILDIDPYVRALCVSDQFSLIKYSASRIAVSYIRLSRLCKTRWLIVTYSTSLYGREEDIRLVCYTIIFL